MWPEYPQDIATGSIACNCEGRCDFANGLSELDSSTEFDKIFCI